MAAVSTIWRSCDVRNDSYDVVPHYAMTVQAPFVSPLDVRALMRVSLCRCPQGFAKLLPRGHDLFVLDVDEYNLSLEIRDRLLQFYST